MLSDQKFHFLGIQMAHYFANNFSQILSNISTDLNTVSQRKQCRGEKKEQIITVNLRKVLELFYIWKNGIFCLFV